MPRFLKIMIGFIFVVVVGGAITGHLQKGHGYPWPYPYWHHSKSIEWEYPTWQEGEDLCEEHCDDAGHETYSWDPAMVMYPEDGDILNGHCKCM